MHDCTHVLHAHTHTEYVISDILLSLSHAPLLLSQVPPGPLGFEEAGTIMRRAGGVDIPPDASLEYEVELLRVSVPPS